MSGYLPDGCTEPSDRETYADEFDSDRESDEDDLPGVEELEAESEDDAA